MSKNMGNEDIGSSVKPPRRIGMVERYKGDYVILGNERGASFAGLVHNVNNGHVELLPYTWTEYSINGIRCVIKEDGLPLSLAIDTIVSVIPSTRKDLEGYCDYQTGVETINFLRLQKEKIQLMIDAAKVSVQNKKL